MKVNSKQKTVLIIAIIFAFVFAVMGVVLLSINGCKNNKDPNDNTKDFAFKTVLEAERVVGYSVLRYYGADKNIIIPSKYSSLPILQIEEEAFLGNSSIEKVTLPESLTIIKARAFKNNINLLEINFPANLSTISESAFENCTKLRSVTFNGNKLTSLSKEVFKNCSSLTSLILPDNITSLGEYALYNCSSLTEIYIPSGVNLAVSNVIDGCVKLTNIFYNCTNIGQMPIANTLDKVLYYSVNEPTNYPSVGASYWRYVNNVPVEWQIEEIDANLTFTLLSDGINYEVSSCNTLAETVIIPKRCNGRPVVSISSSAFEGCVNLTSVTIGKDIKYIGASAFADCVNLSSANFTNPNGWFVENTDGTNSLEVGENLSNTSIAAVCLKTTYNSKNWQRG